MISARTLADRDRKRIDIKKSTYRAILEQFCRKINNASTLGNHDVFLTTPRFVVGFPAYDVFVATSYLERQLKRLGYKVERAMPHVLHVSWEKPKTTQTVVIDHAQEELPTLVNLHKTAQQLRKKTYQKK